MIILQVKKLIMDFVEERQWNAPSLNDLVYKLALC